MRKQRAAKKRHHHDVATSTTTEGTKRGEGGLGSCAAVLAGFLICYVVGRTFIPTLIGGDNNRSLIIDYAATIVTRNNVKIMNVSHHAQQQQQQDLQQDTTTTAQPTTGASKEDTEKKEDDDNIVQHVLDLPRSTKNVIVNIGANRNPILPKTSSGPCAITLAFEPVVPHLILPHPQLFVIPAAVADKASLATMYSYNNNGVSSSLGKAAEQSFWNTGYQDKGIRIVPVVAMRDVLRSVPPNVTIDFLQTDTQGWDYTIIKSSIRDIQARGIPYLKTEVWTDNIVTYRGADNDICHDWFPLMDQHGYSLVGIYCYKEGGTKYFSGQEMRNDCIRTRKQQQKNNNNATTTTTTRVAGLREADALWKLSTIREDVDVSLFDYPIHNKGSPPPAFTAEEYASCKV